VKALVLAIVLAIALAVALPLALALAAGPGQPGKDLMFQTPAYVLPCHKWAVLVDAMAHLGYGRFMGVYGPQLSKPLKLYAVEAAKFVEAHDLSGASGDVPYITAMIDCGDYRRL